MVCCKTETFDSPSDDRHDDSPCSGGESSEQTLLPGNRHPGGSVCNSAGDCLKQAANISGGCAGDATASLSRLPFPGENAFTKRDMP